MITDPAFVLGDFKASLPRRIPAGALVVDAGAGQCEQRLPLSHTRYVGIDLAVGEASWDYSRLDVIGDLTRLPVQNSVADAILCLQVLEHVPDPAAVIAEFSRVVKTGGKVYLSTPQTWSQHQKPYDFYRYTSFGLRWLLEGHGFRIVQLEPVGGYFINLAVTLKGLPSVIRLPGSGDVFLIPLRTLLFPLLRIWFPIIAHFLDRLDEVRDYTIGYVVEAVRIVDSVPRDQGCSHVWDRSCR